MKKNKNQTSKIKKHHKKQKKVEIVSNHKTFKFLGYCKCGSIIGSGDLESKRIYTCPQCCSRCGVGKLRKVNSSDKPISKKDYLENNINAEHLDAPYIASEDVPPEILKRFEEGDL
jgi:hypothetical protein